MTAIQIHTDHVIKKQDSRFPEGDKYIALNAVDAPVVRLLDSYAHGPDRYLALERAARLDLERIVAFDLGFSCLGNPLTDLALRTGASTMPFPEHMDVRALVDRYIELPGNASPGFQAAPSRPTF